MSEVFQVESVQSCERDMFLLLAPDSLWHCPFYRKGTRKNSSWGGEGINALCQLIGQWVTDFLNRGIDSRKEIDLWLLHLLLSKALYYLNLVWSIMSPSRMLKQFMISTWIDNKKNSKNNVNVILPQRKYFVLMTK